MIALLLGLALAQAPADDAPTEPTGPFDPDEGLPLPSPQPVPDEADEPDAPDAPDAPAPAPAAPAPAPVADEEIVVYGQLAIAKARDALLRQMEALGWSGSEKADGTVVFKGPRGWMGKARFDPELASLDFRRNAAGFRLADYEQPGYPQQTPVRPPDPDGMANEAPVSSGAGFWLLPRKKKVDAEWQKVRAATHDELMAYQKVKYATAFETRLQGISDRLDALWTSGRPLDDGGVPVPEDQRLQAIVDFWATRADTPEGLRMTKAVEAWITNRLESVPDALKGPAEARREDGRAFPEM